jgi:serine/threonine protein kinase/Tfp pilus assembly protein PilF
MSLENWEKIKEIFLGAIELAPTERARFLQEKCGDNHELFTELEKMLAQAEEASGLMSRPAIENTAVHFIADSFGSGDCLIGEVIGAYRLTEELGRGGMGAVYLATRIDGTFRRRVAVKLIKRGMETEFILRRFRNERQVLAALNHPNIAQLFDGGTTAHGSPYFVMEYVEGEPLYRFCDNRKLPIKERLEIFLQVCEAVNAAHQIKVVHRDLKPSNILVKADGQPKLLDFGIAKLLDPELSDSTAVVTATQMRMMTPEYASPEQVSGEVITPASDIYSLGVILYELLSGHRPYRFKNRAAHEIARVVCEQSPESLSKSLDNPETFLERGEAATLELVLETRCSKLAELRRELSGELERIVMNALHKRAEERYASALELAADLLLYLQNKPIKTRYVAAAKQTASGEDERPSVAVLPLQIIGAELSADTGDKYLSVGLADAMITRLSNVQRIIVRPTSSVLRFANLPDVFAAGRELNADYVLSGTIRRAGERIRVSAQLLNIKTSATVWADKFDENLTDVLELEDTVAERVANLLITKLTGEEQKKLAKRGTDMAAAFEAYLRGRYHLYQITPGEVVKAKTYFEEAIRLDTEYALAYVGLAEYYFVTGTFSPVPPLDCYEKAREMAERALSIDDSLGEAFGILGYTYFGDFNFEKIEKNLERSIELNPNYLFARIWRSGLLVYYGRFNEAVADAKRCLELNPLGAFEHTHYLWILYQTRCFKEAVAVGRKAIAADPYFIHGIGAFSWVLRHLGQTNEAIEYARRVVEMTGSSPRAVNEMASCYAKAGETEKARQILRKLDETQAVNHVSPCSLAISYLNLGDQERSLAELEKAFVIRDPLLLWIASEPEADPLRADERFIDLEQRIKNYSK